MERIGKARNGAKECMRRRKIKNNDEVQGNNRGFFDPSHCNSSTLEICHYNSTILKFAIIILDLSSLCHFLRLPDN